jgi:predicted nucleotidyltransferase
MGLSRMHSKNDRRLEYHQIPHHVRDTIDRLIHALNDHNIPVQRAILFGSYARGNYSEWSDIDLAIVSEVFIGSRFDDKNKIRYIYLSISSDLEILPYRPEDFTDDDPFVKEILETGIPVL